MRTADLDILIVPGSGRLDPDHWQARWGRNLKTARIVDVVDTGNGLEPETLPRIVAAAHAATRPVALVAHAAGVAAVAHAAGLLPRDRIAGGFLVAPISAQVAITQHALGAVPMVPLPFPSIVLASADNPDCPLDEARTFARAWGSAFTEAGPMGRIDVASGQGPWPDGLLRFGVFLKSLDADKDRPVS